MERPRNRRFWRNRSTKDEGEMKREKVQSVREVYRREKE